MIENSIKNKIGLIGFGYWGKIIYNNLKQLDLEIIIVESDDTKLEGLSITEKKEVLNPDDNAITLAFEKHRADDRKKWLMLYDKNEIIKYENKKVSYSDFIHYDFKHFSIDDNIWLFGHSDFHCLFDY